MNDCYYKIRIGYKICEYDFYVYIKSLGDDSFIFFLLFYTDDMLITIKSMSEVKKLKTCFSREFDMKNLSASKMILGMEIRIDRTTRRLWLFQDNHVEKVLERFNINNAKLISIPLMNHFRLCIV